MHPTTFPPEIVERVIARRGRLNVFEALDPARTALLVIDMQNAFLAPGAPVEVPVAREIVPHVNALAAAARQAGALVAWVQMTLSRREEWPVFFDHVLSPQSAEAMLAALTPGSEGHRLWPQLDVGPADLVVGKNRFSAFSPGACDLPDILRARGIEQLLICGTLTNVCCETSARDAMMQDFKVILVSDAMACRSDAEHLAALTIFATSFGDVRPTAETTRLLRAAAERHAAGRAAAE